MAHKQTWAIIGATSPTGQAVAKALANDYRLLLMDRPENALQTAVTSVQLHYPQADLEAIGCCKEASWEADAVVVAVTDNSLLPEIAAKLNVVTNCKPVVHLAVNKEDIGYFEQALPHAKVVTVWLEQPLPLAQDAVLHGTDAEAVQVAQIVLSKAICQ